MLKGLYILGTFELIYGPAEQADIASQVDIYAPQQTAASAAENPWLLAEAEVIFSGWGGPKIDADFLAAAPKLRMVFYGSGSIKATVTDAFWDRGVRITSAYAGNGVPVAEYTLSQILFGLKRGWYFALAMKRDKKHPPRPAVPGAYGSTVGILSLGVIGRTVCRMLQPFDVKVIAYDPYASRQDAQDLGVELCSLEEVFRRSDVVSCHTPRLRETEGMIQGRHFASMKADASFINTARGAVVREEEMIEVLQSRPDIYAVLDVTFPEPPEPDSPLYTLPNVVLTPHIAGSMGNECRRMGRYMVEELQRYVRGEPLEWEITRDTAAIMA